MTLVVVHLLAVLLAVPLAVADMKQDIIDRCRRQIGQYGNAMVKVCVDQDIQAEKALKRY